MSVNNMLYKKGEITFLISVLGEDLLRKMKIRVIILISKSDDKKKSCEKVMLGMNKQ